MKRMKHSKKGIRLRQVGVKAIDETFKVSINYRIQELEEKGGHEEKTGGQERGESRLGRGERD